MKGQIFYYMQSDVSSISPLGGHAAGATVLKRSHQPLPQPRSLSAALLEAQLTLLGSLLAVVSQPNQLQVGLLCSYSWDSSSSSIAADLSGGACDYLDVMLGADSDDQRQTSDQP